MLEASPGPGPAPAPPQASTPAASNVWAEHAPPRLDSEAVQRTQASFRANYPGEHLDADGMPSIRLRVCILPPPFLPLPLPGLPLVPLLSLCMGGRARG